MKEEAWPQARTPDELHDALIIHGFIAQTEGEANHWDGFFDGLVAERRATRLWVKDHLVLWIATERISMFKAVFSDAEIDPEHELPAHIGQEKWSFEEALREITRGRLEALGPVIVTQLAQAIGLPESKIEQALIALEVEGFVFRGKFTPGLGVEEWCERRYLQRIHKYTMESLRQGIEPVSVQDFMRFLFAHHNMRAEDRPTGPGTLQKMLDQLEGYEAPAAAWESELIPSRIAEYDPVWLDALCMSGRILWGRFNRPTATSSRGRKAGPVKRTPICLVSRTHADLWREIARDEAKEEKLSHPAQIIMDYLEKHGASFFGDMASNTSLLKAQVESGLAELVGRGRVTSDGYVGLRALLTPNYNKPNRWRKHRKAVFGVEQAGRWSLMRNGQEPQTNKLDFEALEQLAFIYIRRWGVLFRSLLEKEAFAPPWRMLVRVLRRLELRGDVRGGRFVASVSGEQFAFPETVERLRKIRKEKKTGELIAISAADPLNMLGVILPGKKVAHLASNRILFRDGVPIAVLEAKEVKYLKEIPDTELWEVQQALTRRAFPPMLRTYLGKSYR